MTNKDKTLDKQPENNQKETEKKPTGFQNHPENINRAGRPPKGTAITDLLRTYLDETDTKTKKERKQILIEKIFKMATCKDADLAAIKYIVDRIDGKPTEKVETDNNTELNIKIDWE